MRYHIDTIPVWDALHAGDECLLCLLRRKTEHLLADRYLGASVMEPDTRIRVNGTGFCKTHHQMLYGLQNRLGHALMVHTHLMEVRKKLGRLARPEAPAPALPWRRAARKDASPGQALRALSEGCVLCDDLDRHMQSYAYSLVHLWKTDRGFQEAFLTSKGPCLPDCALLMDMAPELLKGEELRDFCQALQTMLDDRLAVIEGAESGSP